MRNRPTILFVINLLQILFQYGNHRNIFVWRNGEGRCTGHVVFGVARQQPSKPPASTAHFYFERYLSCQVAFFEQKYYG